jgi:hypothetical protein
MSTNNDANIFQSALSATTAAINSGGAVPTEGTAAALASAPSEFRGQALEALAEALPALVSSSNWERFSWQEEQLRDGTPPASLDEKWKEHRAWQQGNLQQVIARMSPLKEETDKNNTDVWTRIRQFETHLGFAEDLAGKICNTIAPQDGAAGTISLNGLLPQGLLPQDDLDASDPPYDHTLHLFVRELLTRLGQTGRQLPQVVKACGRTLARLFPDENGDPEGSFVFRQDLCRVQDYIDQHPNDILALCWRGELACWDGDEQLAEEIALQVWEDTQDASPAVNASLLWFFALTHERSYFWESLRWRHPASPGMGGHFGGVRGDWYDREEDLALAVIRRAVGQGSWDRGFLEAVARLQPDSDYLLPTDLLPAECWVWLAENSAAFRVDSLYPYYLSWHAAFDASAGEPSSDTSFLSSIVVLAGCVLGSSTSYVRTPLKSVLERLESLVAHPQHGQPAWCALGAAHDLLSQLPMRQLTSADRLALNTVWRRVETSLKEADHRLVSEETVDAAEQILRVNYPSLRDQAESEMRKHLGERLWNALGKKTQDYLWRGRAQYDQELELDRDRADFGPAILLFSNALLNEVVLRFWMPVSKSPSSKKDAREAYSKMKCQPHDPEWGDFVRLFDALKNGEWSSIKNHAQSRGINMNALIDARHELEYLRREGRTKTPHRRQIDREAAAVLYDKLIHRGLMRTVFAVLNRL